MAHVVRLILSALGGKKKSRNVYMSQCLGKHMAVELLFFPLALKLNGSREYSVHWNLGQSMYLINS